MLGEIIRAGDAALLSSLVTRERETVMDLEMEANMTAMPGVRETSCVVPTTALSLVCTSILRTTAVREHRR